MSEITEQQVRAWIEGFLYYGPESPPEHVRQLVTLAARDPRMFHEYFKDLQFFAGRYPQYSRTKEEMVSEHHEEESLTGDL